MTTLISKADKTIGQSVEYILPVPLSAADYEGAMLYADSDVYFSDGDDWKKFVTEDEIDDFSTQAEELFLQGFTDATLPLASENIYRYVYNEDQVLTQFSDGVEWKSIVDESTAAALITDTIQNNILKDVREVTVGASGDYPTITDAIEFLLGVIPASAKAPNVGRIKILSGHVIQKQIEFFGIEMGWIEIDSEDAVVNVNASNFDDVDIFLEAAKPIFLFRGGVAPQLNITLNITNQPEPPNTVGVIYENAVGYNKEFGIRNANVGVKYVGARGKIEKLTTTNCCVGIEIEDSLVSVGPGSRFRSQQGNAVSLLVSGASTANVDTADVRVVEGVNSSPDYIVRQGAFLSINSATLGNGNIAANTLTSNGILFRY